MRPTLENITAAQDRISAIIVNTPLIPSPFLSERAGEQFLLKLEMMQPVGAFKLRGAANAVFCLKNNGRGVTCCSTGNHGRGVAYAARARGIEAVICMSRLVPQVKVDGIRALGAQVRIVGDSQDEALEESLRLVGEDGLTEISPFDDANVIAGQGTIGLEILEANPEIATILVPLSGGGLAGGIALAAKHINPAIKVIGISMQRGAAMFESIRAGKPVEVTEYASLADSLGGGIGLDNKLSFDLCRDYLDDIVLVSEAEIYRAMQVLFYEDRMVCEGASAVGVAALMAGKLDSLKGPVVSIVTGRNVDMGDYLKVINGQDITLGDVVVKGEKYGA